MAKKAGLQLIISLVDEATSGLQKITGGMKGLALVGGAAVVAGMVAVGKAAWDAGQIYDEAMDTIVTKTGASGDALAGLEQDFKAVFSSVPTDAKTAADVIAELNQKVGMTGPALQGASAQLLEMTRMLGGDAAANASNFGRVMGDWSLTADQAGGTLDKMFVAAQQSGIGIDSLMQKVVQFGAPLRNMGFTLDESVALLANFEKEGVNTELVMGSLRIAAGKFAKEGKPLKESLMATFDAIQKNTDASAALAMGMEVFGARAGPDMVAAIREGRFSVDDLAAAMAGAEGAIMKTADATADFPEKFQVLRNKVTTLLMPLGNLMVTGLSAAVDAIGPAVDGAIAWIQKIAGEGTMLGNLWSTLQSIAQVVWPQVQAVIMAAVAMIDSVLGAHGTEIVALMQTAWDKISEIINLAWQLISAIIAVAAPAIQAVIVPVFDAIRGFLQEHGDTIMAILGAAWDVIRSAIEIALALIKGIISVALAVVQGDWSGAWDAIKVMTESIWESIKTVIGAALTIIQSVVTIALDLLKGIWQRTWDAIKSLVNSALGAIRSAISGALSAIKSGWEGTWNSLKNFVSSVWNSIKGTVSAGLAAVVNALASVRLPNPFAVLQGFIDAARKAIDDFLNWLRNLKVPNPFANFKLPTLPFGANAILEPASQGRVLFAGIGGGAGSAGSAAQTAPGNTFIFQFAAPATAYDERRIEASVERAMLRAGVRADAMRRTR